MSQETETQRSQEVGQSQVVEQVKWHLSIQTDSDSLGPVFYPQLAFQQLLGAFQVKGI